MRILTTLLIWLTLSLPAVAQTSIFDLDNRLVQFALSQISSPGSFEITADLVEDAEGATRLNGVEISDGTGVWLTIEQLVVDWNSSAILRGQLELERIIIRGLDMQRLPSPNAEAPELDVQQTQGTPSPFDWPRAPIPVSLDQMTLEDIRIGPDVLGQSLTFDGHGSARDQGDEQRLELTITRTDDIDGEIDLTYLRDFAAETLAVDLIARESAGGVVAMLAGFPEDSASAVQLSGNGPRDNWQLTFDAETDDVFEAAGAAVISYVEPLGVTADFVLVPGPEMSPSIRAVTGERAELDVAIVQGADRVLRIDALELDSPALQLNGTGSFDLTTQASDLAIRVEGNRELSNLVDGVAFAGFTFEGQVTGPPDDLTAQGQSALIDFQSALVDAERVTLTLNARRLDERLRFTADGTGTGLRLDQVDADTLGEATLRIDVVQEGELVELNTARLDSPLISFSAEGRTDLSFQNADLSIDLSTDSVAPIARSYGQEATGELALIGRVQRNEGVLDGRLSGRIADFRSPPADLERFDLVVELGQQGEDISINLDGTATGLRIDELEAGLIGPAEIEAQATLGTQTLTLNSFTLRSTPLDIDLSATQERETGLAQFEARVQTQEAEPFAQAYGIDASGRLDLRAEGTVSEGVLSATTTAQVLEPRFADIARADRLNLNASVVGGAEAGYTVRGALDAEQLSAMDVSADVIGPVRLETELLFADGVLDLQRIDLTSRAVDATGAAQYAIDGGDLSARLDAEVPRLAPLAEAFGQPLEGALTLTAEVARIDDVIDAEVQTYLRGGAYGELVDIAAAEIRLSLDGPLDDYTVAANAEMAGLRVDRLTPEILGPVTLDATARITDSALVTAEADLTSDALSGTLTPREGGQVLDYALRSTNIADLASAYDTQASGVLRAEGTVSLGEPIRIDGSAGVRGLSVAGTPLGTIALEHEVVLGDDIAANIALIGSDGTLANTDVTADIALSDGTLILRDLDGTLVGQRLSGRAEVDLATLLTEATLDLSRADLSLIPLADLDGTGSGRITLSPRGGRQDATVSLNLNGAGTGAITAASTRIEADATDLLGGDPGIAADVVVEGLDLGAAQITTADIDANGRLSDLTVGVAATGTALEKPLTLDTRAQVAMQGGATNVSVSTLNTTVGDARISLERPLQLSIAGGAVRADDIAIRLPGAGMLTGSVQLIGGGLVGSLQANGVDLETLVEELGVPVVAGRLDATAQFDTRPSRASATLNGTLVNFVGSDVLEEGLTVDAVFEADWNGRVVDAGVIVNGGFEEPFQIEASVPLVARAGSPIPQPAMNQPLSATVRWAGEVRPLWAFVPAPGQILSGLATLDLDVDGTLASPRVGGNVSLSDGRYENLDLGLILTELTIISDIDPNGNLGFVVQGSDGGQGFVSGTLNLDPGDGPLTLVSEFVAEDAVLIRRDDLTAQISGTVGVNGPLTALDVAGDLNVDRAEFRLVNATPPEIVTLGDVRIIGVPEEEEERSAPTSISLNIDIRAADGLFVRGRGLESEWALALDVRGTAASPRITGQIERLRGTFSLIGRSFDLEEGVITFDGGANIDPRLNIVLSRTDDDLTGQIIISGSASDPQIDFASQPALPQEEVLPQLLFGQSQQSLNAGQALQLASGLATLLSGNSGPFDVARGALGVDVLQLDAGSGGDGSSLTVGKTLSQGVFIGAETALDGSGENTVVIELDVIRNVVIDARISAGSGSSSVGISYSRDF